MPLDSLPTDFLQPAIGWASTTPQRLAAPPGNERGALFRAVSRFSVMLGRQDVPDVISVLHLNPRLFWPWLVFASRLMPYGKLPATLREKIILRTGWNCRSRYEWGQHVEIALRVGVTDAEIVALTQGPQACADQRDRAALQACDELCSGYQISDTTWQALAGLFSDKELVELTLLIGHYQMIAGFLNSAGLVLEPPVEAVLQAFYQRVGS
jgi:alkylhydroperoxidase family enzyme